MSNLSGIADHNGANAETLAAGYKTIDRKHVYPEIYAAASTGQKLHILDIGAGAGNDAYEMAKLGHTVVAVEPSDLRAIAERDHAHPSIEYRDGLLPELASVKPDEKFDMVMLSAVWQYIDPSERVASLVRIGQTMKPGGQLMITYPSPPSRAHQFEASPEMLAKELQEANAQLPVGKKLSFSAAPVVLPDSRGRKSVDGTERDIQFYTFALRSGHAQSLGARTGFGPPTV